jgi:phospholipid transport system substrate-binding protein
MTGRLGGRVSAWCAGLAFVILIAGSARAEESAAQFLDQFGAEAIRVLADKSLGGGQRNAELRKLFVDNFDVDYIGRFVLARYWRNASEADKEDFRKNFEDYIVATYSRRFGSYSGEKIVVGQTFPGEDANHSVVRSSVERPNGDTMTVDWRMQKHDDQWRIVDVLVEGVSMMVTQRSEFNAVLQRENGSLAALNKRLRALTADLNNSPANTNS